MKSQFFFLNIKEVKNGEDTNFLVFFDFYFFGYHLNNELI